MRTRRSAAFLTLPLLVAAAARLSAQVVPTPAGSAVQAGDRVRLTVTDFAVAGARRTCEGRVAAVEGDTVVVAGASARASRRCPSGAATATGPLRVARGDRGSRLTHTLLGALGGAVAGGVAARLSAGDGCRVRGCDDGGYGTAARTMAGVYVGALAGGLIGLALPAGSRWVPAGAPGPVRVAGLALLPGLRVALAGRP